MTTNDKNDGNSITIQANSIHHPHSNWREYPPDDDDDDDDDDNDDDDENDDDGDDDDDDDDVEDWSIFDWKGDDGAIIVTEATNHTIFFVFLVLFEHMLYMFETNKKHEQYKYPGLTFF